MPMPEGCAENTLLLRFTITLIAKSQPNNTSLHEQKRYQVKRRWFVTKSTV
jgi:hypothetical protein